MKTDKEKLDEMKDSLTSLIDAIQECADIYEIKSLHSDVFIKQITRIIEKSGE